MAMRLGPVSFGLKSHNRSRKAYSAITRPKLSHMARKMISISPWGLSGSAARRFLRATRWPRSQGPMVRIKRAAASAVPSGLRLRTAQNNLSRMWPPSADSRRLTARRSRMVQ